MPQWGCRQLSNNGTLGKNLVSPLVVCTYYTCALYFVHSLLVQLFSSLVCLSYVVVLARVFKLLVRVAPSSSSVASCLPMILEFCRACSCFGLRASQAQCFLGPYCCLTSFLYYCAFEGNFYRLFTPLAINRSFHLVDLEQPKVCPHSEILLGKHSLVFIVANLPKLAKMVWETEQGGFLWPCFNLILMRSEHTTSLGV